MLPSLCINKFQKMTSIIIKNLVYINHLQPWPLLKRIQTLLSWALTDLCLDWTQKGRKPGLVTILGVWHKSTRHQAWSFYHEHLSHAQCWPLIIHGPVCFLLSFKSFLQIKVVFTTSLVKCVQNWDLKITFNSSSPPSLLSFLPLQTAKKNWCL